jgi:hypothetical protein
MPNTQSASGTPHRLGNALRQVPPYEPPTVADLARVQKGGGGETIDEKYLKTPGQKSTGKS